MLKIGQTIFLNGIEYTLQRYLGRGAVSDVYLAVSPAAPGDEIILKFVRADQTDHALHQEAEVLTRLNEAEDDASASLTTMPARLAWAKTTALQRHIIALLDSGEWQGLPVLAQEKAPPAFERFPVAEENDDRLRLTSEQRMLEVWRTVAGVMALAHSQNLTLKDFEPQTKADRVRFDPDSQNLKVIDWNITGGPEDKAQDLFYWGGHLYYGCLGHPLELDEANQPPVRLGMGVSGWNCLSEGTRQVLQQVLHRDPTRRYQRVTDLVNDLDWWLETLHRMSTTGALEKLQDRLWQARGQARHDRALAAADLALRLVPMGEKRGLFTEWARQARQELEKADWVPLADARASLLTGAYSRAAQEFAAQLNLLPSESAPARLARLYQQLALAGNQLKLVQGTDIRQTPVWEALKRAVEAIVNNQWFEADEALTEGVNLQPEITLWRPIQELQGLIRANRLFDEATALSVQAEPRPTDIAQSDWIKIEQEQLQFLAEAADKFDEAERLASYEPGFMEQTRLARKQLEQRQILSPSYEQAQKYAQQGQEALTSANPSTALRLFQAGLEVVQSILNINPAESRARYLQSRFESWRQKATLTLSDPAEEQGVAAARQQVDRNCLQTEAQANLVELAGRRLADLYRVYQTGDLNQAETRRKELQHWNTRTLALLPGGENLAYEVGRQRFTLPDDIQTALAQLETDLAKINRGCDQARLAYLNQEYQIVIEILTRLQADHLPLPPEALGWLAEAAQTLKTATEAETLAKAGLEHQARRTLDEAEWQLQQGQANETARLAERILAWPRQFPEGFNGDVRLPFWRSYTYPPELVERARTLLERAQAHQRIEAWLLEGQYAAVKTELGELSRGWPLLKLEQEWQQETERRLAARVQARQALEPETGAVGWERALAGLAGDPGAEAAEIKQALWEQVEQQQARLHLAQAEELAQAGNWPALALAVEAGLKQEEQPLLTETEQRAGVRVRTFQLPGVVKERLLTLQARGQLGQQIKQAVEATRVQEDWTEVRETLARLGKVEPTAQEREWDEEAQRQLDEEKRRENWTRGELDRRGRDLTEAARKEIATGRLAAARECLRQVLEVWPGQSLAERFPQVALPRAVGQKPARVSPEVEAEARQVQGQIRLKELAKEFSPGWTEWWDEQRAASLANLAQALAELSQQAGLVGEAGNLQQRVIGEITQRLQQQLVQAKAGDSRASDQLEVLGAGVPGEWQKQPGLVELGRAINVYLGAVSQLNAWQEERERINQKFEQNPTLTFAEVQVQMGRQVWPEGLDKPDWPEGVERMEALETFFAHLEQAAQVEEGARRSGGEEARGEYAAEVYQLAERWSQAEAWKQSLPLKQVERLQGDLSARMGTQLVELKTALDTAVNSFRQNLDDPQIVGDLYWQARWCRELWPDRPPEALIAARKSLNRLFKTLQDEAAQSFKQSIEQRQPEKLAQIERLLEGLIRLNHVRAEPPSNQVKRPPGLAPQEFQPRQSCFDLNALTRWRDLVGLLRELTGQPIKFPSSFQRHELRIEPIEQEIGPFLAQLRSLEGIHDSLKLTTWPETGLAQICIEIQLLGDTAETLKKSVQLMETGQQPKANLKFLSQSLSELARKAAEVGRHLPDVPVLENTPAVFSDSLLAARWQALWQLLIDHLDELTANLIEQISKWLIKADEKDQRSLADKLARLQEGFPPENQLFPHICAAIAQAISNASDRSPRSAQLYQEIGATVAETLLGYWTEATLAKQAGEEAVWRLEKILHYIPLMGGESPQQTGAILLKAQKEHAKKYPAQAAASREIVEAAYQRVYGQKLKSSRGFW